MKTKILIIIFALFLLLLTACSPQKSSGGDITAQVVAEKSQGIASQSSPASVIGNIGHKKEKEGLGINSQIISSELLSNEKIKIYEEIKDTRKSVDFRYLLEIFDFH